MASTRPRPRAGTGAFHLLASSTEREYCLCVSCIGFARPPATLASSRWRSKRARRASFYVDVYTDSTVGMRDRRDRTGYREGVMSQQMRDALRAEADRLAGLEEPAARARAVGDFFAALDMELETIAAVRLDAVAALRARGMTYQRIATATGLSVPRVAQLARTAGTGGRVRPNPTS